MIESIELKNFKKHESLKLDVPEGVTSIQGDNAKGKSSILKGILFGLLGAASAGAKDHLWRWGADGEKSVALEMILPDHGRIRIIRTHKDAQIMDMNGRILASGNTPVTKFIEESLGMIAKDLRTLIYSPQGESQGILTMGPSALQGKVESLARVNVVDDVLGMISKDMAYMGGKLESMQIADLDSLLRQKAELESATLHYHNEYQNIEGQIISIQGMIAGLQAEAGHIRVSNERVERNKAAFIAAQTEMDRMVAASSKLYDELAGISVETDETYTEVSQRTEAAESKLATYVERLRTQRNKEGKIKTLIAEISELEKVVENHNVAHAELQQVKPLIESLKLDISKTSREVSDLQVSIASLKRSLQEAVCPLCKREMEGVDQSAIKAALTNHETTLSDATARLKGFNQESYTLLTKERDLTNRLNALAESRLSVAKGQLETLKGMSDDTEITETVITALQESVDQGQQWLRAENTRRTRKEKLAAQYSAYTSLLEEKRKALIDLSAKADEPIIDIGSILLNIQAKKGSMSALSKARDDWKSKVIQAETTIAAITRELEAGQTLQEERSQLEGKKADTEELQKYLRKNRSSFSEDVWGGLLNYASALIQNTTDGRLSDLTRAESGDFSIKEEGRTVPVSESSGAQRSIVGLALRIALSKIFYGDNLLLLLDEATSDASDETAAAISGMLNSLNFKIISVSHRQGDTVNAGNIVEL